MTDPAIIAASYAAERNYTHNPDDVIGASNAVGAWGTAKESTSELSDLSGHNNIAAIKGPMPTEGFIQGRRFTAANRNYLDCGNDSIFDITDEITIELLINPNDQISSNYIVSKMGSWGVGQWLDAAFYFRIITDEKIRLAISTNGTTEQTVTTLTPLQIGVYSHIKGTYDGSNLKIYINGILNNSAAASGAININTDNLVIGALKSIASDECVDGLIGYARIYNCAGSEDEKKQDFNILARLPFWSVNYTDYPDNVTEYTDNLPYSSSIISSGTFKVDNDTLQCVSAGTMTYSASYEFDGSEYIKVEIDGVEYAGTGTITQGNTTVSVAQGSNKVTIVMGTGDTIEGEIGIQFREEV